MDFTSPKAKGLLARARQLENAGRNEEATTLRRAAVTAEQEHQKKQQKKSK